MKRASWPALAGDSRKCAWVDKKTKAWVVMHKPSAQDVVNIRDNLVKEFGIDKYRP
jgi:hypothetical protein